MRKTTMMGGAALMAAMLAAAPQQADAQARARGQRMMNDTDRPGVEMVMRLRDRLELTEEQVSQLDGIRQAVVQHRAAMAAEREELRSQRMATPRDREDREAMREEWEAQREAAQARRDAARAFSEGIRSQVESILTDQQMEELQDAAGRARAFERGRRAGMRQGQSMRGRQAPGGARGGFRQGRRPEGRGAWAPGVRGVQRWGPPGRGASFRRGGQGGAPGAGG